MKTSPESPIRNALPTPMERRAVRDSHPHISGREGERWKPSGWHRIGPPRTKTAAPRQAEPRPLPQPLPSEPARFSWVALAVAVAALGMQWLAANELGLVLVALCPLLLVLLRPADSKSAFEAAALWLLSACAELLHPPSSLAALANTRLAPHRLIALLVLGLIVLRLRNAYTRIQELGRRDPLTGLLNRRGFEELAARELRRAGRYQRPVAFALIDIDRFKAINDRFGHATGDRVLQLVAARLRELRASDFAVRLGGDEFGLLMPETDQAGARLLLARLEQRLREDSRAQGWPVSISVGVSDNQTATRPLDALIAEADRRMYFVKSARP